MMGNFHGPGGSLDVDLMVFDDFILSMLRRRKPKRIKLRGIGKERSWRAMEKVKREI